MITPALPTAQDSCEQHVEVPCHYVTHEGLDDGAHMRRMTQSLRAGRLPEASSQTDCLNTGSTTACPPPPPPEL